MKNPYEPPLDNERLGKVSMKQAPSSTACNLYRRLYASDFISFYTCENISDKLHQAYGSLPTLKSGNNKKPTC